MKFFDLKTGIFCGNSASYPRKDLKHEQRKICVCPIDGVSSDIRVSEMRREIQRRIQSQEFLVHGSVSDNGVCSTHLQRKSAGYCNMSGCSGGKTLSHGNTHKADEKQSRTCEFGPRLEDISGIRFEPCEQSYPTVRKDSSFSRMRSEGSSFRSRFDDHRHMSFSLPVGKIPKTQRGCETAYSFGREKLYASDHIYYGRQNSRCLYSGSAATDCSGILCHGSGIRGFRTALQVLRSNGFLCYKSEKELQIQNPGIFQCRQVYRSFRRSENRTDRICGKKEISHSSAQNSICGLGNKEAFCFSHEQLSPSCNNNSIPLQVPLADRIFFQMDQAKPEDKKFFRNVFQCGQNTDMDCCSGLRYGGSRQDSTWPHAEPLRNLSNSECCYFRETSYYPNTYRG